jgi:hypothetical protein
MIIYLRQSECKKKKKTRKRAQCKDEMRVLVYPRDSVSEFVASYGKCVYHAKNLSSFEFDSN